MSAAAVIAAVFGLLFGSFANVVIYRLPNGESIVRPPSHCTSCGKRLAAPDLIPVFSWLFLRGRCRYCRAKISARYPAVEAACAALFAYAAFDAYPSLTITAAHCMLAFVLVCVTMIDADSQTIPDGLVIFCAACGLAWVAASYFFELAGPVPTPYEALLGALAGAGPLFIIDRLCLLILKKDGFGMGDVKLMLAAGLYLGPRLAFTSLFMAVIAGGLFGGALLATGRVKRGGYFAFGPFLAAGVLAALWFGDAFLRFFFPIFYL